MSLTLVHPAAASPPSSSPLVTPEARTITGNRVKSGSIILRVTGLIGGEKAHVTLVGVAGGAKERLRLHVERKMIIADLRPGMYQVRARNFRRMGMSLDADVSPKRVRVTASRQSGITIRYTYPETTGPQVDTSVNPTPYVPDTPGAPYAPEPEPTPTSPPPPSPVRGDINGDGKVDTFDIDHLNSYWGTSEPRADLNADGIVNVIDLSILVSLVNTG